jgi:hypothetical protein
MPPAATQRKITDTDNGVDICGTASINDRIFGISN